MALLEASCGSTANLLSVDQFLKKMVGLGFGKTLFLYFSSPRPKAEQKNQALLAAAQRGTLRNCRRSWYML